jgi:acyl-[acyl-carrier-protein]-phospholipid O-acyltransferase/long-chain-fatty-acid--[acyl-carrier-protein] ligase
VFEGYLNDEEKTRAAFRDGWFVTGDLGRFDEEGFLFIEGRLSRFSKIGGEMVPHGTVENKLIELFDLDQTAGYVVVVIGVPDASKGEALVLLTTLELTSDAVREKLLGGGLPGLWVPRIIHRVEKIPVLGTGKLDLKGCREMALAAVKG